MRNAGRRLTRAMIIEHVWNLTFDSTTNVVDVYINYLRRKVDDGFTPSLIHTVRGVGYQMSPEEHAGMSTSPHSFPKLPQGPDVLGELLHSLEPAADGLALFARTFDWTKLRSSDRRVFRRLCNRPRKSIGMVQLMREYLDAEQAGPEASSWSRWRRRCEAWSKNWRRSRRCAESGCAWWAHARRTLAVPESRLRLALQYLIAVDDRRATGGRQGVAGSGRECRRERFCGRRAIGSCEIGADGHFTCGRHRTWTRTPDAAACPAGCCQPVV